jgi:hypothetical protein
VRSCSLPSRKPSLHVQCFARGIDLADGEIDEVVIDVRSQEAHRILEQGFDLGHGLVEGLVAKVLDAFTAHDTSSKPMVWDLEQTSSGILQPLVVGSAKEPPALVAAARLRKCLALSAPHGDPTYRPLQHLDRFSDHVTVGLHH